MSALVELGTLRVRPEAVAAYYPGDRRWPGDEPGTCVVVTGAPGPIWVDLPPARVAEILGEIA